MRFVLGEGCNGGWRGAAALWAAAATTITEGALRAEVKLPAPTGHLSSYPSHTKRFLR